MANETVRIINVKAKERTLEIRVALFDESGKMLTDQIYDSLETDGSHTEEQILAFAKRKAILYLQRLAIKENLIDQTIKKLPDNIKITADDLAKADPMTIEEAKKK